MLIKTTARAALIAALVLATAAAWPRAASAETVLRIGMTAADIPRTLGQPDQGFEGNRFTGVAHDLIHSEPPFLKSLSTSSRFPTSMESRIL